MSHVTFHSHRWVFFWLSSGWSSGAKTTCNKLYYREQKQTYNRVVQHFFLFCGFDLSSYFVSCYVSVTGNGHVRRYSLNSLSSTLVLTSLVCRPPPIISLPLPSLSCMWGYTFLWLSQLVKACWATQQLSLLSLVVETLSFHLSLYPSALFLSALTTPSHFCVVSSSPRLSSTLTVHRVVQISVLSSPINIHDYCINTQIRTVVGVLCLLVRPIISCIFDVFQ